MSAEVAEILIPPACRICRNFVGHTESGEPAEYECSKGDFEVFVDLGESTGTRDGTPPCGGEKFARRERRREPQPPIISWKA